MVVAKRQEREKPVKIEGRSKKGLRTGMRTSGRKALLAEPNLHRAGPGGRKHIKGGAKHSFALSLPHANTLSQLPSTPAPGTPVSSSTLFSSLRMDSPAIF